MERLTDYRVPFGTKKQIYPCFSADIVPCDNFSVMFCENSIGCEFAHISNRVCPYLRIIDKLAAYEDTGLEPEEIESIVDAYGRGMTLRTESAKRLELMRDISTERLKEFAQAEKDGRLVVLPPCKAGERIFKIVDMQSHSVYKDFVTDAEVLPFGVPIKSIIGGAIIIPIEDFGKTVFLTREEAEAALKKRGEADNGAD